MIRTSLVAAYVTVAALLLAHPATQAAGATVRDLQLHGLFGDGCVLQAAADCRVFGWAPAGTAVTVTLTNTAGTRVAASKAATTSKTTGRWEATLINPPAGGPYTLTASGGRFRRTAKNVLVGQVLLASGQSNARVSFDDMIVLNDKKVTGPGNWKQLAEKEVAAAGKDPFIRLLNLPEVKSSKEIQDVTTKWTGDDPASVRKSSAMGYLLAKRLRAEFKQPIGIVVAAHGSTSIQQQLPPAALAALKIDKKYLTSRSSPKENVFNSMIAPLAGFQFAANIYYQGELDAGYGAASPIVPVYGRLLTALLAAWRQRLRQTALQFYIVQLPNCATKYPRPAGSTRDTWAAVREAQRRAVLADQRAMLIATIDIGESSTVHPPNKFDLAARLAGAILVRRYGRTNVRATGPTFKSLVLDAKGVAAVLFDNVGGGGGLTVGTKKPEPGGFVPAPNQKGPVVGCFEVQASNGKWYLSKGTLAGEPMRSRVLLPRNASAPAKAAKAVRYAWADDPTCANLFSAEGRPTVPFLAGGTTAAS